MKKKVFIIFTAALMLLTACNHSENNPSKAGKTSAEAPDFSQTASLTDTGTAKQDANAPDEVSFLIGLDKKPIYLSDLVKITDLDGNEIAGDGITIDKLSADSLGTAECEGFCYLAQPVKPAQNNLDTEGYEPSNASGSVEQYDDIVFKRYNVGDKYGDLTVKKAGVKFDSEAYNNEYFGWEPAYKGKDIDFPEVFYKEQYVEFEGEVTLTGYLMVNESSDYFPELEGETELMVSGGTDVLPVFKAEMSLDEKGGFFTCGYVTFGTYKENLLESLDPYGTISLGNIKNIPSDTSKMDLNPNNYTKVKVTIHKIVMPGDVEFVNGPALIKAEVKALEVVE